MNLIAIGCLLGAIWNLFTGDFLSAAICASFWLVLFLIN
jgi:hypothetical protein